MWTRPVGNGERDDELVGGRCVGDAKLDRVEMGPNHHRGLVVDGDVEAGALPTAFLDARQDRDAAGKTSRRFTEARVKYSRDVLELTVLADDATFAVRLDVPVEQRQGTHHELRRKLLTGVLEQLEVV